MPQTITADGDQQIYPANESISERAGYWYDQIIRHRIETRKNLGKYMVINPESGEYVMGSDPEAEDNLEVSREARARFGTHRLFGMRVGYPAVAAIGATLTPHEHLTGDGDDARERA